MSDNASSAELVTHRGMANSRTASMTDAHVGGLRHQADLHAQSQAQNTMETNMREAAYYEVGRARNFSAVV